MTRTAWTAQAETLADVQELGDDIALMAGRCRATGLDVRAFAPIMGAAMALGSRPWRVMEHAYASDQELIAELLEHELAIRRRESGYIKLRSNIVKARAWAVASFTTAQRKHPPDQAAMEHWAAVAADCNTALDVLAPLPGKLRAARAALNRAPGELGETYQQVYDLLAQGRVMPHEGRWLTGEETQCSST